MRTINAAITATGIHSPRFEDTDAAPAEVRPLRKVQKLTDCKRAPVFR
jgi:hypothetical protein